MEQRQSNVVFACVVTFVFGLLILASAALCVPNEAYASNGVSMYRLYNPNSGEHFYTAEQAEHDNLVSLGWNDEGYGWIAPATSNTPVYRLYNAIGGEHHYTMDANERNMLIEAGWNDEGIGWYSDDAKGQVLYREYNPNAFSNNHNYTTDQTEHDYLVSIGWNDEGLAWYGIKGSVSSVSYSDGVKSVDATKASVSEDGASAIISGNALPDVPSEGDVVVVADANMQGTAIKVTNAERTEDGSYRVSGTEPEFGEVFNELKLTGKESIDGAKISYLAPGVEINGGLSDQGELSVQSIDLEKTVYGDTLSFSIGQEFFNQPVVSKNVSLSASGSLDVSITPSVEFELEYEFPRFKKTKAIAHVEESVSGSIEASGEAKIPVPCCTLELGVARFDVYVVIDASGSVGIVLDEADASFGVNWYEGSASSPFVYSLEHKGLSSTIELTGKIGVGAEAEIGVLCFDDVAEAHLEAGGRASVSAEKTRSPTLKCQDRNAWVYAEAGVSVMKEIADIGNFNSEILREIWSKDSSPLKFSQHLENGVEVPECTWNLQSHHYEIVMKAMNWDQAKAECEKRGGHLATITSAAEQSIIDKLNTNSSRLWVGGFRSSGASDDWQWVTGESWDYTNWDDGEPNNSRNVITNETKVSVWPSKWNDLANTSREQSGYICEWDDDASWANRDKK